MQNYWVVQATESTLNNIKKANGRGYKVLFSDKVFLVLDGDISSIRPFILSAVRITEEEYLELTNQRKSTFSINQPVVCISGKYNGFTGIIAEIENDELVVELSVFGAMNIVRLKHDEVTTLDITAPWDKEEKSPLERIFPSLATKR